MRLVVAVVAAAFVVHVARKAVGDLKYIQNDHMKNKHWVNFDRDKIRNNEISISNLLNKYTKISEYICKSDAISFYNVILLVILNSALSQL